MDQAVVISGPGWDISSEYTDVDDPGLAADLQTLLALFDEVDALNGKLQGGGAVAAAQEIAGLREKASTLLANVSTYARCRLSVDARDADALTLNGSLDHYRKQFGDVFEPWSQFVDSAEADQIEAYLSHPEVAPSAFEVHHRRARSHERLTLSEESLVNGLSQDGIHAWGRLYDQIAGALQCDVAVDNEIQTMGLAQASGLLMTADDTQRRAAWQAINRAWQGHEESCAAAINAIAGWRLEMCRQRSREREVHFLDAPVHMNRIARDTLDTVLQVAADNRALAQRAAALQARVYGKSGFGPWDLRAPAPRLSRDDSGAVAFDEAVEIIAGAYGQVHGDMQDFVHMMVKNRWIEGTVGPRKAPGAYCTGFAKSRTPRVYMTYTGGQSDVITLAHELGHALHAWVMRDLPESQRSYGMSLAETASTFGETLVRDALLARSTSTQQRLDIMWEEMSAFNAFMLNIPTRFEFERNFYEARKARPLQAAELKDMMSKAWQSWYGDALAEPDEMFWASKLHFYISGLSFYNFPYLFGYLFSSGVCARRAAMGEDFYEKYVALLRDTGRMTAEELASRHLDAALQQPQFWQDTVDALGARVDAFAELLDEIER